jgi:hypothetical protein
VQTLVSRRLADKPGGLWRIPSKAALPGEEDVRMTGFTLRRVAALVAALGCGGLGLVASPAAAVQLGQVDSFAAGLDGWGTGAASPVPPEWVDGGGPGGASDGYLRLFSAGGAGAGARLVAIAGGQWTGDFGAAGVTGLSLWLRNEGDTALSLRLWLRGAAGAAFSLQPVLLAPGSGWQAASYGLRAADFSGPAAAVLAGVTELRLYHGSSAGAPTEAILARVGVDNVSAVPEPAAAGLWLAGLAALGALSLRRQAARRPSRQPE